MSTLTQSKSLAPAPRQPRRVDVARRRSARSCLEQLNKGFGQQFALFDVARGELQYRPPEWLEIDLMSRVAVIEAVQRRGRPEIIEDFAPLVLLAVPLPIDTNEVSSQLAITPLVTQPVGSVDDIASAAYTLGADAELAFEWARSRTVWPPNGALALAESIEQNIASARIEGTLRRQLSNVSQHLLLSLEELSLLHRLTEQLTLSPSSHDLVELALDWLSNVVPAQSLVVHLAEDAVLSDGEDERTLAWGESPIPMEWIPQLIGQLGQRADTDCVMLTGADLQSTDWPYPELNQLICAPIRTADARVGWLLALGERSGLPTNDEEFGVIESSLLTSVAAILAVQFSNLQRYREQRDFFSSVVKALSSAIDAKDHYTRGHSERVARVSVCLARHLGCSDAELKTLSFGGLMHDIGKIGIDDAVLRKPDRLTPEEYEHIKLHPDLGCDILAGIKQLEHLLPVVRFHHEAWDGSGYPQGLVGEECPKLARIAAVADAFDAMGSDRPYRKGMPIDKLEAILRDGAGKQWDPVVVDAFFAVREEIHEIVEQANSELKPLSLAQRRSVRGSEPNGSTGIAT